MTATPDVAPDEVEKGPWLATDVESHAEKAVIGALMTPLHAPGRDGQAPEVLSSPVIPEVRRVLEPGHFYHPRHKLIATVVFDLADDGRRGIDMLMVADELVRRDQLTAAGGAPYLHQLVTAVPTTANAGWYADIVRAGANRRAAYAFSQRVAQACANPAEPERLTEIITGLHGDYVGSVAATAGHDLPSVGNSGDLVDQIVYQWGQPRASSMSTGLADVDRLLNVEDGALVVVAGRPGSGKSILGAQIAAHYVEERGEPVLFFSAEMSTGELMERDLARLARVRLDTATGKTDLTPAESVRLVQVADEYKARGTLMWYDDTPNLSTQHIAARYTEVTATAGPPRLVVVDYLQLMQMPKADRRDLAIGEVTRRLKLFAKQHNIIVVLLCQLNRGPEQRTGGIPMLSDLRESGSIEQDTDVVILIHDVARFDESRLGEVDLILAKQRKGAHGITVGVADHRPYATFSNLARRAAGGDGAVDLDSMDRNGDQWWQK